MNFVLVDISREKEFILKTEPMIMLKEELETYDDYGEFIDVTLDSTVESIIWAAMSVISDLQVKPYKFNEIKVDLFSCRELSAMSNDRINYIESGINKLVSDIVDLLINKLSLLNVIQVDHTANLCNLIRNIAIIGLFKEE